jgi:hypothetical protein
MKNHQQSQAASSFPYEVLTTTELAERLKVKESWVVDQSKPSRTADPIPVFRLGKHRRYLWGSPALNAWLGRRSGSPSPASHTQAR